MFTTESRKFKKLRISLTDRCNMACTYCVPENHKDGIRSHFSPSLSVSDMVLLINELHKNLQLDKIRVTGGEPLMHPQIVHLIKEIKKMGIDDIGITSNGFYFKKLASRLKNAGLKSVNISLDAVDELVFHQITRTPFLKKTIEGIESAINSGFDVKINSVILKGINTNQIIPLLKFGIKNKVQVRFLELMKMGYLHHNYQTFLFTQNEILSEIHKLYPTEKCLRPVSSTANHWKVEGQDYTFGIIANETAPFCNDCNRLRLDSYGKIYGCISSNHGISILKKIKLKQPINNELNLALQQKQPVRFTGSNISMRHLGG